MEEQEEKQEDPQVGEPELTEQEPEPVPPTPAELVVMGLATLLDAFEKELDEGELTQAFFVAPTGETLDVEGFGSALPDLIYFDGRDDSGHRTRTIVPSGAASLTLKAVPAPEHDEEREPRRVGFRIRNLTPEHTPPDV